MTAVSTLRDDLTFIASVSLNIFPQYNFSHSFLPRIYADSRNSKNIQGFVNTLDILEIPSLQSGITLSLESHEYSSGQYQQAISI